MISATRVKSAWDAFRGFGFLAGLAAGLTVIAVLEWLISQVPSRRLKMLAGHVWAGPGGHRCYHCHVPRAYTRHWHITTGKAHPSRAPSEAHVFGTGVYSYDADSPLCQNCWEELGTPRARLPYYLVWIEDCREAIRSYLCRPIWRIDPVDDWEIDLAVRHLGEWAERVVYEEARESPSSPLSTADRNRWSGSHQAYSGNATTNN